MTDDNPIAAAAAKDEEGVVDLQEMGSVEESLVDLDSLSSSSSNSDSSDSSSDSSSYTSESSSSSSSSSESSTALGSSVEDDDGWDTGAESTDDEQQSDDDDDTAVAVATSSTAPTLQDINEAMTQEALTVEQMDEALGPIQPQYSYEQPNEQEQYMEDEYDARQQQYITDDDEFAKHYMNIHYVEDQYHARQEQFLEEVYKDEPYLPQEEPFLDEEDPLVTWQPVKSQDETHPDSFEDEYDSDIAPTPILVLLPRIIACTCILIVVLVVVLVVVIQGKKNSPNFFVTPMPSASPVTPPTSPPVTSPPTASPVNPPSATPTMTPTMIPTSPPTVNPWFVEIDNLETDDNVSLQRFRYQIDASANGLTMVVLSLDRDTETVLIYNLQDNAWQEMAFTVATQGMRRHLQQESSTKSEMVLSESGRELLIFNNQGTNVYQLNSQNEWVRKGTSFSEKGTLSGDGKSVVTGSVFYRWNGNLWVEDPTRTLPFNDFEAMSLSMDGSVLAVMVADASGTALHALQWEESTAQWKDQILSKEPIQFALSSDGTTIVEISNETATVYRFVQNEWVVFGSSIQQSYNEVAVSADGLTFAAAADTGWAQIYDYDAEAGEWIETAPNKVVVPSGNGISGVWLSGNGNRLGLGVVPRFESGSSFIMTFSRIIATGPTAAPSILSVRECNGLANLCEVRANEMMFAAARRSATSTATDYVAALEMGVRGLEWEITTDLDFASEVAVGIFGFVFDNPNEVVVLHLQIDQVDEKTVENLLVGTQASGSFDIFGEYFYAHPLNDTPWPTVGEMIDANQRVIVFVNNSSSEVFNNWNAFVVEIDDQTFCDTESDIDFSAIYFGTNASDNNPTSFLSDLDLYVNECEVPNFVFFDHFGTDNTAIVVEAVQKYNAITSSGTPAPTSASPSLVPSFSPYPTISFAPSDAPSLVPTSEPSTSASPTFGPTFTLQPSITAEPTSSSFVPTSSLYPTGSAYPTGTYFPTLSLTSSTTSLPAENTIETMSPTLSETSFETNIFDRPSG